ncbi:MAG: DUF4832 domain-containing protein [Planctomycetaceae bacterium]|jgi:hypothetical protein|nr:DUF4832 domain-containing protein [Planctomycetaceae bacterium]
MRQIVLVFVLFVLFFNTVQKSVAEDTVVRPSDNGEVLLNPGMGWTMHFYSNGVSIYGAKLEPSDTLDWFPGCSTIYLRLPWSSVEPEEGKFNWAIVDTPAQRWIAKGKKIAFRFTCCEFGIGCGTPEWVRKAGAKGINFDKQHPYGKKENGQGGWVPFYDDPVFLEKLDHFLAAAGKRYNNNPDVEFIDIGSFGMWGEGHTWYEHRLSQEETDKITKIHINLHKKHFPDTLLCISDSISKAGDGPWPGMEYAFSQGVTFRDDSMLVRPYPHKPWDNAKMARELFSKTLPIILEHGHYGYTIEQKTWSGDVLLKIVEDHQASFMSIHWWPDIYLKENKETIEKINQRLGYRLQLRELRYPKQVSITTPFSVNWIWANTGVAPCYGGGFPALTIKDDKDGIVSVLVEDSFDVKSLSVAPPNETKEHEVKSEFRIGLMGPATKPGNYNVYVSVGRRDGTPQIALPLSDSD